MMTAVLKDLSFPAKGMEGSLTDLFLRLIECKCIDDMPFDSLHTHRNTILDAMIQY